MSAALENLPRHRLRDEIRVWIWGIWIFWFIECLLLYFQVTFYEGAWSLTEGWGIIQSDLKRFTPVDVLTALLVDFAAGVVLCIGSVLLLRAVRSFFRRIEISPFAFHGAAYFSIILFLYGAVIINVALAPLSFNPREQFITVLWGVVSVLTGVLVYRHVKRHEVTGREAIALWALTCTLLFCLFGVWPSLEFHTRLKWYLPIGIAAKIGILVAMVVVEQGLIRRLVRKRRENQESDSKMKHSNWVAGVFALLPIIIALVAALVEAMPEKGLSPSSVSLSSKNPPNVLLISMDTVRADALSCYSPSTGHTPFIDSIAAKGALFEQARSASPWTLPGHASMFTSLYPSVHRATWEYTYLKSEFVTIAEIFKAAGYKTAAFSSNIWITSFTNMVQGFDYYYLIGTKGGVFPKSQERPLLLWEVIQRPVLARLLRWGLIPPEPVPKKKNNSEIINDMIHEWTIDSKNAAGPAFIFVNYMNAHHPYDPPGKFRPSPPKNLNIEKVRRVNNNPLRFLAGKDNLDTAELEYFKSLYYSAVSYEDIIIKQLFLILEQAGFFKNAIVVITADHGEYLGEYGQICHLFGAQEPVVRVPLIIFAPERIKAGLRYNGLTQTIDILPTLLELAGIKFKGDTVFQGKSLVKPYTENIPVRQYSISELEYPALPLRALRKETDNKEIYAKWETRQRTMTDGRYQLETHADGYTRLWLLGENVTKYTDITDQEPAKLKFLKDELGRLMGAFPNFKLGGNEMPVMTPELRRKLKALNYMD